MRLTFIMLFTAFAAASFANPQNISQCANIAKQCEAAGFQPGEHKKNGKGLWVDCIQVIAKGGTVSGVTATKEEAQSCLDAAKAKRAEHKGKK